MMLASLQLPSSLAGREIDHPEVTRPHNSEIPAGILRFSPNSRLGRCLASPHLQGRDNLMDSIVIGIDVSKDQLDVATPDGVGQWPNAPDGHRQLVEQLAKWPLEAIVLEATGGYERAIVAELAAAGLPVVVVNPRQVRDFARATGQLAKTDVIVAVHWSLVMEFVGVEAKEKGIRGMTNA